MKKVFFGIFALVLCFSSLKVNAQESVTPEQAQQHLKEVMASITDGVSFAYSDGVSLDEFKRTLCNGQPVATKEGDVILNQAFDYLSRKLSTEDIIRTDDGKAIAMGLKYLYDHRRGENIDTDGSELFGSNLAQNSATGAKPCKWYQFFCHLGNFFDWLFGNWGSIKTLLTDLHSIFPHMW